MVQARNRVLHQMLVDGVPVEYSDNKGAVRGGQTRIIDFDDPVSNDLLAVNQFTVTENNNTRRRDIVLFVNGLLLVVIELKNPTDEDTTIWTAWQRLLTYKAELPSLFSMNELLMVSDGSHARLGTLTAGREWFKPWSTISGEALADSHLPQSQVLLEGVCTPGRLLSLVRNFIVFEDEGGGVLVKKVLGDETLRSIARELVETVCNNVTIDWTLRESVRAHLRVLVKRDLRRHGYPPDKQEKATRTVLEQAEVLSAERAA